VIAVIQRPLPQAARPIQLARGPEAGELDRAQTIELAIVAAGARRDLGELDAAVVGLQLPELNPARRDPWSPRLFYAYADNLLAAGRQAEAVQWFVHAADVDEDGATDAAARLAELTGDPVPDDADPVVFLEQDVAAPAVETPAVAASDVDTEADEATTAVDVEVAVDEAPVVADVEVAVDEAPIVLDVEVAVDGVADAEVAGPADDAPGSTVDPVSDATAGSEVRVAADHPQDEEVGTDDMVDDRP
jgi:hypothetical protein